MGNRRRMLLLQARLCAEQNPAMTCACIMRQAKVPHAPPPLTTDTLR
jgi:hypothetical protein